MFAKEIVLKQLPRDYHDTSIFSLYPLKLRSVGYCICYMWSLWSSWILYSLTLLDLWSSIIWITLSLRVIGGPVLKSPRHSHLSCFTEQGFIYYVPQSGHVFSYAPEVVLSCASREGSLHDPFSPLMSTVALQMLSFWNFICPGSSTLMI